MSLANNNSGSPSKLLAPRFPADGVAYEGSSSPSASRPNSPSRFKATFGKATGALRRKTADGQGVGAGGAGGGLVSGAGGEELIGGPSFDMVPPSGGNSRPVTPTGPPHHPGPVSPGGMGAGRMSNDFARMVNLQPGAQAQQQPQQHHGAPGGFPSSATAISAAPSGPRHMPSWTNAGASTASGATSGTGGGLFAPQATRAAKKRISIDMVGAPQAGTFVHAAHASDADQAEAILKKWGRDGMGKIADPAWVEPIKEALRMQAARSQAEAIAEIQAALHQDSVINDNNRPPLHVVNGVPSNFTVSTSNTAGGTLGHHNAPVSPGRPFQGQGIAEEGPPYQQGYQSGARGGAMDEDFFGPNAGMQPPHARQAGSPLASPRRLAPPSLPRTNTSGTLVMNSPGLETAMTTTPDYMRYKPASPAAARPVSKYDGLPGVAPGGIGAIFEAPSDRPLTMVMRDMPATMPGGFADQDDTSAANNSGAVVPLGANVRPSLTTVEKSVAAKIYFENLYYGILKKPRARDTRRAGLETELAALRISEGAKEAIRARWMANETDYLRDVRARVSINSFAKLKTIGHGAFGVVALVRERGSGELFAMKQLRKADMLRKGQEGHVRAERDLMTSASASANANWIVKLVYSFQDSDHLYLIM